MNTVFLSPFALLTLLALPVLAAIYLFRSRFQTLYVSTLMFWDTGKKPGQGGLHLRRLQTPLSFLIEFFLIILLVLAAAGPTFRSTKDSMNFVIVLDDSFSMLAGTSVDSAAASAVQTPRDKAVRAVGDLLADSGGFSAHFILAADQPRILDVTAQSLVSASALLKNWRCLSNTADIEKALILASELAGKTARVLVITDHPPKDIIQRDSLEWWAFGTPLPNMAFVGASRTLADTKDNCMLTVANFSSQPAAADIVIEKIDSSQIILRKTIDIPQNGVERFFFEANSDLPPLKASFRSDFLQIDDQVVLSPQPVKPVRIRLSLDDPLLADAVKKAVQAVDFAHISTVSPHLLITDRAGYVANEPLAWTVQFNTEQNAVPFTGPFILDLTHPVADGLYLEGVIWGAAENSPSYGSPVIAAGNVPLITDSYTPSNTHFIRINFNHTISTLTKTPDWPVLFYNLLKWRQLQLPGLNKTNFNLGEEIVFLPDSSLPTLTITSPAGLNTSFSSDLPSVSIRAEMPGLYILNSAGRQFPFSVNTLSHEESNLAAADSGKWGKWNVSNLFWWQYRTVDWLLLLAALTLLTVHSLIVTGRMGEKL